MRVGMDFTRPSPFSNTVVAVRRGDDGRWFMQVHPEGDSEAQAPVYLKEPAREPTLRAAETVAGWLGAAVELHQ